MTTSLITSRRKIQDEGNKDVIRGIGIKDEEMVNINRHKVTTRKKDLRHFNSAIIDRGKRK